MGTNRTIYPLKNDRNIHAWEVPLPESTKKIDTMLQELITVPHLERASEKEQRNEISFQKRALARETFGAFGQWWTMLMLPDYMAREKS